MVEDIDKSKIDAKAKATIRDKMKREYARKMNSIDMQRASNSSSNTIDIK